MFAVKKIAQALHFIVEGLQGWVSEEKPSQAQLVRLGEVGRIHAQGGERAGVILDLGSDLTGKVHEMLDDDADDMEAVGDDFGVWEPFADQGAVRAGEVDADHAHTFTALEGLKEGDQVGAGSALDDIEDLVVFKIAKSGGKALALVEGVLVDAKH